MAKRGVKERREAAEALGFTPPVRREARIDLRVTPEELDEIKEVADSLGLTLSEYLRQCHKRAVEALRKGGT
jgi:predicted DNA binding CopG/RHH family protein